jgi:hypothetical protein
MNTGELRTFIIILYRTAEKEYVNTGQLSTYKLIHRVDDVYVNTGS